MDALSTRPAPVRCRQPLEQDKPWIGKFKRSSRHREAWAILGAVAAAANARRPSFRVAQPIAWNPEHGLYFQSLLAGDEVAGRITGDDAGTLDTMANIGRLHCELHRLPSDELPSRTPGNHCAQAVRDLSFISWMLPTLRETLAPLAAAIASVPAEGQVERTFCHGDLVCSQLLEERGQWSITDFDLAHLGDPSRDMAILLASLDYDAPALAAAAADESIDDSAFHATIDSLAGHYLEGYASAGGPRIAPDRLRWQRLLAEIYYLALMLKKDRFAPRAFMRRFERASRLAGVSRWT
jgi:thiamine kinase-like enzyme